jgi:hypothetical protein
MSLQNATETQWKLITQNDFMSYKAIVLGDNNIVGFTNASGEHHQMATGHAACHASRPWRPRDLSHSSYCSCRLPFILLDQPPLNHCIHCH